MPKTLTPVNVFPSSIPNFPLSGNNEPLALGPLEAAIQAVLDRTESLHQSRLTVEGAGVKRVQKVASLAALQSLAGMGDGDTVDVEGYGRYRLYNPSALAADGLWVLTAAGGGRWVHLLNLMRGSNSGLATLTGGGRLAQDVRDASILDQHLADGAVTAPKLADQGVTGAKLAPGAALANLGYTPANRAGDTMTGVLTVAPNIGQALNLKGGSADHVYLGLYARAAAQNVRSGWIGYGGAGTDVLNIANERPGGLVAVNDTILPTERGDINFHSDWNSYTTPGYYRVVDAGSSAVNTPPASHPWGVLLVIKAGTAITQLYTQHNGPGTFVRQAWNGNNWLPWAELSPRFIGCRVRRTTDVVINATSVTIDWDAEDFDPQGMHDNAVNPSRIVIPRTGTYLITALLRWSAFSNPLNRYATLLRNGGAEETVSEINGPGVMDIGSIVKQCNANDYLELRVSVSGSSATLGALNTYLMVTYLGS